MSSFRVNSSMYGTQRLVQCAIDNQMSNGERTKMSQSCTINELMSFEYALDTLKHYLNILSIGHIVSRIPSIAHCMFVNQRPTRSHHLLFRKNDRCHQMMDRFQCQTYTGDDRQTIPPNGHHRSYSIGRTRHDIFIPSTSSLQSQSILVFSIIGSILMLMQLVPGMRLMIIALNYPNKNNVKLYILTEMVTTHFPFSITQKYFNFIYLTINHNTSNYKCWFVLSV